MASASIFLSLPAACSEQGPYPSMYGVWLSCLGSSTHTALPNRMEFKAFRLINSLPLTDCLDSLSHRRDVASLFIFYRYFHANCMPLPLPRPRCTRLSTFFHPYSVYIPNARVNQYLHSFIPYINKLWNSLPLSVFPPAYDLNSFKRGVSRHFSHKIGLPLHVYISPNVLCTGSGDKRNFFLTYFCFSLSQYSFNVQKKKKLLAVSDMYFIIAQLYFIVISMTHIFVCRCSGNFFQIIHYWQKSCDLRW